MLRSITGISIAALLIVGCSTASDPSASARTPVADGVVPSCDDVPRVSGPPDAYGDEPMYVANEMPAEAVQAWVTGKPGFEVLWIDREHNGWINVAFSIDAAARQVELDAAFPGEGVVAVAVDWTMAELEALQEKIHSQLRPLFPVSSSILVMQGVVEVGVGELTTDRLAAVQERFGGERVCVAGIDPSLLPAPGPQLGKGDGWRLLATEMDAGAPYRTGIAFDAASYRVLWADAGISMELPPVDFETEVAIWFGAVFGSSCPGLRLDGVVFDGDRSIVHAVIVNPEPQSLCTADARAHAFVVAVPRARLPVGRFTIQLNADGPPPGAPEERTIVEADLTAPGAVAEPGAVHPDDEVRVPVPDGPGTFVEPGFPMLFRMPVACGIEWLGPLNDVTWRMEVSPGEASFMPEEWAPLVSEVGTLDVEILLEIEPEPRVTATANGHSVEYLPTAEVPADCD